MERSSSSSRREWRRDIIAGLPEDYNHLPFLPLDYNRLHTTILHLHCFFDRYEYVGVVLVN